MRVKSLVVVNVAQDNRQEGIDFFKDVLNAEIGPEVPGLEPYGHRAKGAWVGEDEPMRIEVIEAADETLPIGKQVKRLKPGVLGLTFEVENIDETIAELRAKGYMVNDKIEFDWPDFEYCYECMVHPKGTPLNFSIEFLEFKMKPGREKAQW